jgi:hypothetical protein
MNRNAWIMLAIVAAGAYFLIRRAQTGATAVAAPAGGYTPIPRTFFTAEQAGADLQRAYGTAVPSGAAREMMR